MAPIRSSRPRRVAPSLRTLSALWILAFGCLALAVIADLVWSGDTVRSATDSLVRATSTVAAIDELTADAHAYRRIVEVTEAAGERDGGATREQAEREVRLDLRRLKERIVPGPERPIVKRACRSLGGYLDAVGALGGDGVVARAAAPELFDRALDELDTLHAVAGADAAAAHVAVERVARMSDVAAVTSSVLVLLGVAAALLGVRWSMTRPVLALHSAIQRFRAGETDARAPISGPREVADLTAAFDQMADALARQREEQLAFVAGVAHDLRNPLGAIRLGVHVVARNPGEATRDRTIALLERQIGALARMVDDLLDATRIEAGKLDLHPEPLDLRTLVRECVELYAPTSPTHEIVHALPGAPVVIEGDRVRLEQVLGNLLSNAIKFSPDGSRVDVRLGLAARRAVLEVVDRGIGIPRQTIPELFAPFRRHAPDAAPGAGLGLSVVRRIVLAHRGTIEVESTPGAGSTFRVLLPLAEPAGEVAPGTPRLAPA